MPPKAPTLETAPEPNSHHILANFAYRSTTSVSLTTTLLPRYYAYGAKEVPNIAAIAGVIVIISAFFCIMLMAYTLCILRVPFAKYWRKTWNPLIVIFVLPYHIWRFRMWIKHKGRRNADVKDEDSDEGCSRTMEGPDEELILHELRPLGLGIAGVDGMQAR
ncbi:hypothetical protein BDV96DRAFT_605291 [Lophiotrema nucula]|uniref:Uncharacterized protein n=1 Tax=Lophiotrema nucula TaxID=690887 RepID=A0A6A5YP18_9PLEO|nr:hypothetical protein BDV96DRAFT_605291 [Lophiotrema nucula]